MIVLHLIAFIQICFLPGFILLYSLYRKYLNLEIMFVFSFGLSLLCNYFLVFILSFTGYYSQTVMVAIFALEIITLFIILAVKPIPKLFTQYSHVVTGKSYVDIDNPIVFGIISISFLFLFVLLMAALKNVGSIFQNWDAVVSWNRWAVVFASNSLPTDSYHYPLLIPANWSISYIITGTNWQFLPRAIMPIFLIFMVLTQILLGLRHRNTAWLITAIILLPLLSYNWTDGYADVPVAFFSWLAILCILIATELPASNNKVGCLILLGAIFAVSSAVTKQAGLFIVIVYPIIALLLKAVPKGKVIHYFIIYLLLILFIVAPFYLFAEYNIALGKNSSEVSYVTGNLSLHNNLGYLERIFPSLQNYAHLFGGWLLFLPLLSIAFYACRYRLERILFLTAFLPYLLLWAVFFSYDTRNSALSIPIFALIVGYGGDRLVNKLNNLLSGHFAQLLKNAVPVIISVLLVAVLLAVNGLIDPEKVANKHIEKQKQLGDVNLNTSLYVYFEKNGFIGQVLTDYLYFGYLPTLSEHYRAFSNADPEGIDKLKATDVAYILLTSYNKDNVYKNKLVQYIDAQITEKHFTEIFSYKNGDNQYRLVKLR
ncbi:MAG: hypothetical protein WCK96_06880 [Methylococcales bacterium]